MQLKEGFADLINEKKSLQDLKVHIPSVVNDHEKNYRSVQFNYFNEMLKKLREGKISSNGALTQCRQFNDALMKNYKQFNDHLTSTKQMAQTKQSPRGTKR